MSSAGLVSLRALPPYSVTAGFLQLHLLVDANVFKPPKYLYIWPVNQVV